MATRSVRPMLLGVHQTTGHHYYEMPLQKLEDWPEQLTLASRHFALFLVSDANVISDEVYRLVAQRAARQGLALLYAYGPKSRRVHDLFDAVLWLGSYGDNDWTILTVGQWESDYTLEDAVECFFEAEPIEEWVATCDSYLVVVVGNEEWTHRVRNTLIELLSSPAFDKERPDCAS